uniref:Thaumatin-like protein n=1 Tax=Triticum urartu TaxID=4572 RepID=A0A8R7TC69_TRIUA
MRLDTGKTWTLNVPAFTTGGRVWARTGCSFDGTCNGSCETGDCGGLLACKSGGKPPITYADFTLDQFPRNSFFDISLIYGFNVPMEFLPVPVKGRPACSKGPRCAANITSECPDELKAPGGCNSACAVFQDEQNASYCCTGNTCVPNKYSAFFVRMCPEALSHSSIAPSETAFRCPTGVNYQVVFCPPINLPSSPPSPPLSTKPPSP